nr:39S ribosomal protein L12, mitochondrial-like [Paramormyrops kingsleyae]
MNCTRLCIRTALRIGPKALRQDLGMSVRCGHRALQTSVVRLSEAIAAAPPLDGTPKHYSPKVQQLVNDIASLTLIEVSDLNELLKVGLVQGCVPILAKKLVESLPQEIKANVSKEEAEKLKAALEAAGGTVLLE